MKKKKHTQIPDEAETPPPEEVALPTAEPEAIAEAVSPAEEIRAEPFALPAEEPSTPEPAILEPETPEPTEEGAPVAVPLPVADEPPQPPKAANRWLALAAAGLITLFLSVCLTLAILGAANGGLRYASNSRVILLESEVAGLSTRLDQQGQDIMTLRTRLQALEALENRVTGMQTETTALRQEIDALSATNEQMRADLQAAQAELESMAENSRNFKTFLQGLSELLSKMESTQEAVP